MQITFSKMKWLIFGEETASPDEMANLVKNTDGLIRFLRK